MRRWGTLPSSAPLHGLVADDVGKEKILSVIFNPDSLRLRRTAAGWASTAGHDALVEHTASFDVKINSWHGLKHKRKLDGSALLDVKLHCPCDNSMLVSMS